MNFEEIQRQAKAEWEALQNSERPLIMVGTATCGRAAGALDVEAAVRKTLQELNVDALVMATGCIGLCCMEPIVEIARPGRPRITYGNITATNVSQLLKDYLIDNKPRPDLALGTVGEGQEEGIPRLFDTPMLKPQVRVVLRRCGNIDPENINHYIATGGYSGLVKALKIGPDAVLEEIKKSGLRGRGGAGFPTAQKWDFCRKAPGTQKYIICNADEGDPGAFMNRSLLEGDPHCVLEGMVIGAYVMGASVGYIYVRAEYPLAIVRLRKAIAQMEEYGFLGDNIMGSGFSFHLKIKEGAGAFVCGEETALMASIEGKRGMPRPRPPFPAISGLWGKPTNINNVETWGNAANILQNSGEWFASYGSEKSRGTKTFSLVGKIKRTGLIEIPLGTRLRQVIYDIGGGILDDKGFKAVQSGGPSGGCLPASSLDIPVDYENLAAAGAIVGSGGLVVMDEDTCMVDVARFFLNFTQSESCGKCVPCRVGTRQMLNMLTKITRGEGEPGDIEKLEMWANTVKTGSLCGLGQTAPNPVLTTLRYFRKEYEAHVYDKRCPALVCKPLISFYILPDKCQGCMICHRNCPVEAIKGGKRLVHVIDQEKCTKCGTCFDVCPAKFGAVVKLSGEKVDVPQEPVPVAAGARE
ncbi:MAG: NADH-quinone oxidoreductase subunit NuoF [Chloroflexi bacterium]|nr:NADH-quinone oxidoreductase subunit NuoF [Chloroflexota bacterium]